MDTGAGVSAGGKCRVGGFSHLSDRADLLQLERDRAIHRVARVVGIDSENFWAGKALTSTHLGTTKTYIFGSNLAGAMCDYYYGCSGGGTANTRVLVATQGFADLQLITPDFVVEDGFLAVDGGTLSYAGVDTVSYTSLPTDGVHAIDRNGATIQNLATNFAGQSASVSVASAAVDLNQHGLTGSWYEPASDGQGVEVEVFANPSSGTGSTFVSWFTYDTVVGGAERQRWYTAQGPVVTGQPNATLTIYRNVGGNFNAPPITTPQPVGTATLSFDTCSSGQLSYNFTDGTGRTGTIPLTRLTQNVTCSTTSARPTNADFALSGNWYDSRDVGPGLDHRGQPEFRHRLRRLVHVCTERRRRRGRRATLVHGAIHRGLCAGLPDDPADPLRDHRRVVRHPEAPRAEHRAGGQRNAGLPVVRRGNLQLHLHRRDQQRRIGNHHPATRRPGAPGCTP